MKDNKRVITCKAFNHNAICYGFTTRHGGFSQAPYASLNMAQHVGDHPEHVQKNREAVAIEMALDYRKITWASQVHGDNICKISDESHVGFTGSYDAMITNIKEVPLFAFFADCIPVLLYDKKNNAVGVVHAGWKGTYLEIAAKTVNRMKKEYGSLPEDIVSMIGPGICKEHYEVDKNLFRSFAEIKPAYGKAMTEKDDQYFIDLKKMNNIQLQENSVGRIIDIEICPYCNHKDFFSYRKAKGKTGRFAAFIMLKNGEVGNESK